MTAEETRQEQDHFDFTIGQLDRCLSRMIQWASNPLLPDFNRQTLKHHAEDMDGAATKILNMISKKVLPAKGPSTTKVSVVSMDED